MDKNKQEPLVTVRTAKKMSIWGKLGITFCIMAIILAGLLIWGNWAYNSERKALQVDIYKACHVQASNAENDEFSTELWKAICDRLQQEHQQKYGGRYHYEIYLDRGTP